MPDSSSSTIAKSWTRTDATRRPFCVSHFFDIADSVLFAKEKPQAARNGDEASRARPGKGKKTKAPTATRRVQPPRAAKQQTRRYNESRPAARRPVCRSRAELEAEVARQLARAAPLPDCARGCVFGPPPCLCGACEDAMVREGIYARGRDSGPGAGRAPFAKMAAGPEDWAGVRVSPRSGTRVGDVSVVVDTCDEPVIFVL